jgi:hypothetical protein
VPAAPAPAVGAAGDLSRISFDAPAGWTVQRDAGSFTVIAKRCAFQVFAPFASATPLDQTLDAVFWQQLAGYSLMNGTTYDTVAEGVSAAGWPYRRIETWLRHDTDPNKSASAVGFAADLGGETVIVLGLGGFSDRCLQDEWGKLFHALSFAGHPDHPGAFRDLIIGGWSSTGISLSANQAGMSTYTFAGNGRYDSDGVYISDRRLDELEVLRTTRTFTGNGSWKLDGRTLVMTDDRGNVTTSLIRLETVVERNRQPAEVLYLLKTDAAGTYEVAKTRNE